MIQRLRVQGEEGLAGRVTENVLVEEGVFWASDDRSVVSITLLQAKSVNN